MNSIITILDLLPDLQPPHFHPSGVSLPCPVLSQLHSVRLPEEQALATVWTTPALVMAYRKAVSLEPEVEKVTKIWRDCTVLLPLSIVCCIRLLSLLSVQFHLSFLNWYSHSTKPCRVPKGTDVTVSGHLVHTLFCWSIRPDRDKHTPGMSGGASLCMSGTWGELPSRPIVLK